jgi:hypothetical protein
MAYYTDHEQVVDQALRWAETHEFLGDAIPYHTPSICVGQFEGMLGARVQDIRESWGVDTHPIPFLKDLDPSLIRLDKSSFWWEKYMDLLNTYKRKCTGKIIYGEAAVICNLDFLAGIRDQVRIMTDFYDNPDGVHAVLRRLHEIHREIIFFLRNFFEIDTWGSITRHGTYSNGLTAVPQCDFGFNVGKEHFDEFVMPYLRKECDLLDDVIYHLDGEGNLRHMESIFSIKNIGVIQWVPGAGEAEKKDWTSLFEKINDMGKGLFLDCDIDQVPCLWKKYSAAKRLYLRVWNVKNADQVHRLIDSFDRP